MNQIKDELKFNLTPSMSLELIKFNNLKKELNELKEHAKEDKNNQNLTRINELEKELEKSRKTFINEFRLNNQEEILKYLQRSKMIFFFFKKKDFQKFCRIIYMEGKIILVLSKLYKIKKICATLNRKVNIC